MSFVPWSKSQFHFALKVCNNLSVPEKTQYRQWRTYVLLSILFACIVILFSVVVPYNDDEFLQFIPLICGLFPGNAQFQCNPFDLVLAGTNFVLPLRSYYYCGSVEALLYLPLHLLWSSPILVRFFHMGFFIAGAVLLSRKFQLPLWHVLLGLSLLFPYFFVHIADTAVGNTLQMFSIYLILSLLDEWTKTLRWRYPIVIGLLVFVGFWEKLSYVWYVPGITLLLTMSVFRYRRILSGRTVFLWQMLLAFSIVALLLTVLFLSESPAYPGTYPYFDALMHSGKYSTPADQMEVYGYKGALHAFFHPLDATQRIYFQFESPVFSWAYSIIIYLSLPVLFLYFAWSWKGKKYLETFIEPMLYYLGFVITIVFILAISRTGGMHHSILSYPFLILSFLSTWKILIEHHQACPQYTQKILQYFLIAYVCINTCFFFLLSHQPLRTFSDPMRLFIHKIIQQEEIAERYLVYVPDWGAYFYLSLFGSKKQSTIFNFYYRGDTGIAALQKLAHEQGRKLMIVYSPAQSSRNIFFSSQVELEPCSAIPENAVWTILAEPDPLLKEACRKYEWVTNGGGALSRNIFVRLWLIF